MDKHVVIGFPSYRYVEARAVHTLVTIVHKMSVHHPEVKLTLVWRDGFPVAGCQHCYDNGKDDYEDARNGMAKRAIQIGATHLFMIDSDMSYEGGYELLWRLLSHDVDVVAPMFIRRSAPFEVLAMRRQKSGLYTSIKVAEQRSGKLIEIDASGFGAVLIRTAILEDMKYPWFVFERDMGHVHAEDINFCRKARKRGWRIWVDTCLQVDHIGPHVYRVREGIALQELREEEEYGTESSSDSEAGVGGGKSSEPQVVLEGSGS